MFGFYYNRFRQQCGSVFGNRGALPEGFTELKLRIENENRKLNAALPKCSGQFSRLYSQILNFLISTRT